MPRTRLTMPPVFLVAILIAPGIASAAVTSFTDEAIFLGNATAPIVATFESQSFGLIGGFIEGGVAFSSPQDNLFIIDSTSVNTHPTPTSRGLTGNGNEDIEMTFPAGTHAVGFNEVTNVFAAPVVTVFDSDGAELATMTLTQGPNTYGFVGFVSDVAIAKVRWLATSGDLENTLVDNIRVGSTFAPAAAATWGRIKASYR
jgi:hypothetical protein